MRFSRLDRLMRTKTDDGDGDDAEHAEHGGDLADDAGSTSPAGSPPQPPTTAMLAGMGGPIAPVIVPRWIQLVTLPLALLGLWALARAAGSVFLVLVAAGVLATILNPLVKRFERVMPHGVAILAVFLVALALLTGIGVLLSNPVSSQIHELDHFQRWLNRNGIKVQIEGQGHTALQTLAKRVENSSGSIVSFSRDLLAQVVTTSIDLVLVLVLTVYLLVYAREIGVLVRRIVPPGDGTPGDDYPLLIQRAVTGYVRGQLLFSLIMGSSAAIGLWLLGLTGVFPDGERYTLFFGAFYGLMEFIPYIGPIIGPLPAVLVALFADPISAVWVIILFVALQQLEGHFVAPQVFRISLQINPILIILSLLIGYQLYGVAGALVALPLAAMARQTVVYLRRHLVLEPWTLGARGGRVLPQLRRAAARRGQRLSRDALATSPSWSTHRSRPTA
jgi:predicted PurR-regulated permease PerM